MLPLLRQPAAASSAQPPAKTREVGIVKELKSLVEIELLVEQMKSAPRAFLEEVDEALARQVAQLRDWLAGALAKWNELPPEVKLEVLAARRWRSAGSAAAAFPLAQGAAPAPSPAAASGSGKGGERK